MFAMCCDDLLSWFLDVAQQQQNMVTNGNAGRPDGHRSNIFADAWQVASTCCSMRVATAVDAGHECRPVIA